MFKGVGEIENVYPHSYTGDTKALLLGMGFWGDYFRKPFKQI